ncbi:hypothetical protein OW763_08560 [Clostridium aestuarii]|uniref:Uncharacterized protein n=1 Tax=Clostridium aestuarii TaxID=338193 RepID=A0ABT4CZJ5_9CLOT|nr:hypothetical protein [Clostridium aestuarii]MCY6484408.1 hypothetical protein [Clostridium aestuarii]
MKNFIWDTLYFKIRKKEITKSRYRLRRIKIDTILNILIRNCKEKNIKYNIIDKTHNVILIELIGKRKKILLKYHIADIIFIDEYNSFLSKVKKVNPHKAIYITTGVFEAKIHKLQHRIVFPKKVTLEDYSYFMKTQLGIIEKTIYIFKQKKINFYKYLPI